MNQKMYSLDINLYVHQRSLSHEKVHIRMINHLMKNVYDKYLFKNVQDHARKSQ